MMKSMLTLATLSAAFGKKLKGDDKEDFAAFQDFIKTHDKTYESIEEFAHRFGVFRDFLEIADARNQVDTAEHGVTQFADLSQKEFQDTYLMKPGFYKPRRHENANEEAVITAGTNVDYRNQAGVISAVKNQAQCGSCWAFSATEAIESFGVLQGSMAGNNITVLSAEQSCSCTYSYNGCNGGNPQNVYGTAVQAHGGEESNSDLPYSIVNPNCATCGVQSGKQKWVSTNGYTNAPRNSLQTTLDNTGPPSVCVAAESWNSYNGGVMSACPGSVDHCVQAVGYQTTNVNTAYWIVRNSWGTSWGEAGYIYLAMAGDTCQIQDDINYPKTVATQ